MASTVFTDNISVIYASWLNDINDGIYTTLPTKADLSYVDTQLATKADTSSLANYLSLAGGTMTGDLVMSGASIIETEGAAVASATTTDIWATDGNTRHVTGSVTITSFGTAPQAGARMKLIFDGTPQLTQSANLNLNAGGSNITIGAGDWAEVYADTTTQFDVVVYRKSGAAIVSSSPSGSITSSGYTQNTNKILGRTTASTGAIEEISVGTGLSLSAGTLSSTVTGGMTIGTPVTASGSAIDYASLPSGIKQITISFDQISFTAGASLGVRIGNGGTPSASGYYAGRWTVSSVANTTTGSSITTGFDFVAGGSATADFSGALTLTLIDSSTNTWSCSGMCVLVSGGNYLQATVSGTKTLTGTLDIVRIYGGTFDAGKVNIAYIS